METRILVGKAIVILSPDMRREQIIPGGDIPPRRRVR
jgi:hypothetical protein